MFKKSIFLLSILSLITHHNSYAVDLKPYVKPTLKLAGGIVGSYYALRLFTISKISTQEHKKREAYLDNLQLSKDKQPMNPAIQILKVNSALWDENSKSSNIAFISTAILSWFAFHSGIKDLRALRR